MKSKFFESIGLGSIDIGIVILVLVLLVIILLTLVIIQLVKGSKLKKRYEKFMQGSKASSLEKEIHDLVANVNELNDIADQHSNELDEIFRKHQSAYQKFGLIKYDAFKEMGGKLSCCLCLLDENNNGFIINSVHSSTGCYAYIKKLKQGKCELDLSEEERAALDKAINNK